MLYFTKTKVQERQIFLHQTTFSPRSGIIFSLINYVLSIFQASQAFPPENELKSYFLK
jgi:hypothetical protein